MDEKTRATIPAVVRAALDEDVGTGDLTAALIPPDRQAHAELVCRQHAVICGQAWANEVYRQLDADVELRWQYGEGAKVSAGDVVCRLRGRARSLLTGERSAINFLQTLSGTATSAAHFVNAVSGTGARIMDTRKTLPGLRHAQKYAVTCGGAYNHRFGLFDAILIKENHIVAAGSISAAVEAARRLHARTSVTVEVENLTEAREALATTADRLLLDNFTLEMLHDTVSLRKELASQTELEASGGVTLDTVRAIAETGVDAISVGAITKDLHAVDLSMRFLLEC